MSSPNYKLLTESGQSIVTENSANIVVFSTIEPVFQFGSIVLSGTVSPSSFRIQYQSRGIIFSSGSAQIFYFAFRSYSPVGDRIVVSSGTLIADYDRIYESTGSIRYAGSARFKYLIKLLSKLDLDVSGGENYKYLIKINSSLKLQLSSSELDAHSIRTHTGSGSIASAGSAISTYLVRLLSELNLSASGGAGLKYLIKTISNLELIVSSSIDAKSTRTYTSTGSIRYAGTARSINFRVYYNPSFSFYVEGESNSKFTLLLDISSLQIILSNYLDRKLIYIYNPPLPPIFSNSALNYSNIGQRLVFNVTGLNSGRSIWGTDVYTVDSDLNLVAVHSGALRDGENANIVVEIVDGQNVYAGSERNGVTSRIWRSNTYSRSLRVFPESIKLTGTGAGSGNLVFFPSLVEIIVSGSAKSNSSQSALLILNASGSAESFAKYNFIPEFEILVAGNYFGGISNIESSGQIEIFGSSKCIIIRKYNSNVELNVFSSDQYSTINKIQLDVVVELLELTSDEERYLPNIIYSFGLDSAWLIGGNGTPDFTKNFNSQWSVNSDQYYWYRILFCGSTKEIESRCDSIYIQNSESPYHTKKLYRTLSPPENDFVSSLSNYKERPSSSCISLYEDHIALPSCGPDSLSLITGVLARNISEVCKILKNPRVGPPPNDKCFKCISIKKYIQAVGSGDRNPIYSELIEEEFCNSPECAEFCIDFDLAKELGQEACNDAIEFDMIVMTNIFSYESNLVLESSGNAESLLFWYNSNGLDKLQFNYSADFACSHHQYDFSLGIELGSSISISGSKSSILAEDGSELLLDQIFDTIDLEYAIYEIPDGILDLREYVKYVVSNRIIQFNFNFELFGNTQLVSPYWRSSENQNGIIRIYSDASLAIVKLSYSPTTSHNSYLRLRGSSELVYIRKFLHESSGSIFIDSNFEVLSNYFSYESIGEIIVDPSISEVAFQNRSYQPEGSIFISSVNQKLGLFFDSIAQIEISGSSSSEYVNIIQSVNNIQLEGYAETVSPNYQYDAILEANAQFMAILYFRDLGLFSSVAEIESEISSVSTESVLLDEFSDLSINNNRVSTCGCLSLDLNLNLSHNLESAGELSQYLLRNNYFLPNFIPLRYSSKKNSWSSDILLTGRSVNSNSIEDWNLIFELGCNNIIFGQELDTFYLRFSFFAKRHNRSSNVTWITKMYTNIIPDSVCQNNNLTTKITLNTVTDDIFVDNVLSSFSNVVDNIGLFKNSYWIDRVDCSKARKNQLGKGRRDGFASCEVNGPFPEFKINYPSNPVMNYFQLEPVTQIIL